MRSSIRKHQISQHSSHTTTRVRAYIFELICYTGESHAEAWGAHLGKLDRDDCTLHAELEPERAYRKPTETSRQDPEARMSAGRVLLTGGKGEVVAPRKNIGQGMR